MEAVIEHLRGQWIAYAGVGACCLPLIILFRRQVLPVVWYGIEMTVYLASFHVVLHGVIRLLRWFKIESSFGALHEAKMDPGWETPFLEFWRRELYKPEWLFYFEAVVAALILYAVWRLRPFKVQKLKPRGTSVRSGLASNVRPVPSKSGVRR